MDDDLTASHWDDVLSPSQNQYSSNFALMGSQFGNLNLSDPHKDSESEDENEPEDEAETSPFVDHSSSAFSSARNQDEIDQLNELRKEERQEHSSNLLSELTNGDEPDHDSFTTPKKVDASGDLFEDKGTPIKIKQDTNAAVLLALLPTRTNQLKTGKFRATRSRKYPSKTIVKHLGKQVDSTDPLNSSQPKAEARSEAAQEKKNELLVQEANAPLYEIQAETEEERLQKLATPSVASAAPKTEDSPGNQLDITVGDPLKVGDITTAHIVYAIKTTNKNPDSPHFPAGSHVVTVSRRYKDFRWIYHQLQSNHPGRIIPPPPTKQTYIGRFNENFIENRRLSLEKMLAKMSRLPWLANDPDFVMFLTSEDFINESKERENVSGSGASLQTDNADEDDKSTSLSASIVTGTGGGGFMSSLFSIPVKAPEPDAYFSKKKTYIDDLEHNLKTFYKSLELIASQRLEIITVIEEIASTVDALADLEVSKVTTDLLEAFAEVHVKLKDNLDRVNLQEQLTLGFTINEYLRIITSVKHTFETRQKIYQQYHTFVQELQKKEEALERLNSKYKSSEDKIRLVNFEVDKLKQKVAYYEKNFDTISETIKSEIEAFELAKIEDFRSSVEIFIESLIESQKEAIELWETFYERQNLAQA